MDAKKTNALSGALRRLADRIDNGLCDRLTDEEYDLYCNNQGEYLVNLETKTVFKRELTRDDLLDRYIRPMRNTLLYSQTDKVSKYLRQKDMVAAGLLTNTDITEAQYLSICKYIQELCDMTDTVDPLNPVWPTKPM